MNIIWIPRTLSRQGRSKRRPGVALGVAIATLAWTFSGTVADAQQTKSLQHEGQSFQVVPASQAAGLLSTPSLSQPVSDLDADISQVGCLSGGGGSCGNGQCNSVPCGNGQCTGQCGGNCGGYGSGAGYGGGFGGGGGYGGGMNCPTCDPYNYGRIESVVMRREGLAGFNRHRQRVLSDATLRLDEYDFEFAPRITIGTVPDCVSGYEASFTGPLNWDMSRSETDIEGLTRLSRIDPADSTNPPISFEFNDPDSDGIDIQNQRYESTYWTAEASKTAMAWDIAKLLLGARYINFEEDYRYSAIDKDTDPANPDEGQIYSSTTNNLIGLQVGVDMFSPICRNTSTYLRARAGGYLNLSEATVFVDDQDQRLYAMDDDDNRFAGMFELSNGLHYRLGEMLSVHGGTEIWYLAEVASAEDQIPTLVGARAPTRAIATGEDLLFIGFSFGATLKY